MDEKRSDNGDMQSQNTGPYSIWRLYAISMGFTMVLAPEYNLLSLQTSIGVKNAFGSTNVLIYTLLCIFSLLLYAPLVAVFGRKMCLVVGQIPSILYTLSLLYPRFWTVTPASVLMGIAESTIMPASAAIVAGFQSMATDSYTVEGNRKKNIGIFLTVIALGQTISSVIPELILKNSVDQSSGLNTTYNISVHNISDCGSRDCPMSYVFEANATVFNKLVPTRISLDTLLGSFCAMQVFGIILQYIALPDDKPFGSSSPKTAEEKTALLGARRSSLWFIMKRSFDNLKSLLTSYQCFLTFPMQMHYGMYIGFLWSEFTRAFISCTIGVQHLGISLAVVYLSSFLANAVLSQFSSSTSTAVLITIGYVTETVAMSMCLVWVPASNAWYICYIIAALMGLAHASRRVGVYVVPGVYFEDLDSAYIVQSGALALGTAITYAWSSYLCVYVKIYILLAHSFVSTALALVAYRIHVST